MTIIKKSNMLLRVELTLSGIHRSLGDVGIFYKDYMDAESNYAPVDAYCLVAVSTLPEEFENETDESILLNSTDLINSALLPHMVRIDLQITSVELGEKRLYDEENPGQYILPIDFLINKYGEAAILQRLYTEFSSGDSFTAFLDEQVQKYGAPI
jgi:hypothetical protein